ncbi:MerR family transcriptional regulator [Nonomuraea sp. 3-1Str]|uniref:MerR family transcriptional regulator n=1 Tax=Nonomuraea sp. 3-1Str TaxID=2929801 RepID=UPI0028602E09|nr:MerR family transcriptional regulator [Nonomuraea sp. 3-1Str]MDR8411667.1 MerR family transcriptional regulator [Nonomuraea sp. 3-1Str]
MLADPQVAVEEDDDGVRATALGDRPGAGCNPRGARSERMSQSVTDRTANGDTCMEETGSAPAAEEPGYGIGAVSRRLGVPAPTLRTWNLRYGIGPSRRSPGGHRRYGAAALARLEEMTRLVHAGGPPADAARRALRLPAPPATSRVERPDSSPASQAEEPARPPSDEAPVPSAAMLARAALALDGRTVTAGLAASLARLGVVATWERLVVPTFGTICRRQAETGGGIDVEHLFSERLLAALHPLAARPARPANDRPVLLACAEEEQHSLPVHALAAALATDRLLDTRVLGARTPYPALADAMRRLGPAVVFVWSQLAATGDPAPLAALPALRPPAAVVVGGPGWGPELPPRVPRAASLQEAVTLVAARAH